MSKVAVRRTIPLFITMIMGIIVVVDFYFGGIPGIAQTAPILSKWATIIWVSPCLTQFSQSSSTIYKRSKIGSQDDGTTRFGCCF